MGLDFCGHSLKRAENTQYDFFSSKKHHYFILKKKNTVLLNKKMAALASTLLRSNGACGLYLRGKNEVRPERYPPESLAFRSLFGDFFLYARI